MLGFTNRISTCLENAANNGASRVNVGPKRLLLRSRLFKLRTGEVLFPGIVGYEETVVPQLANAISRRRADFTQNRPLKWSPTAKP